MTLYNEILKWIEDSFSTDELEELEYTEYQMVSDANFYLNRFQIPYKGDWLGIYISFKNIYFFFTNTKELIGYYKDNVFTVRTSIQDWNLCELYNITYVNPYEIKEEKWGVLKYKNEDLFIGIETPVGNDLVNTIYKANIIGALEWKRFKEAGYEFFSESLNNGSYIDNDDLKFIEIEINIK